MASQIEELMSEIRRLCTDKGWRKNIPPNPRNNKEPYAEYVFGSYCALAHSEVTEALEAYRDKIWSGTAPGQGAVPKPIGVGPELADVLIRVLDMCDIWDIDIEYEINRVLKYGWTRPYKHGGRQL